MKRIIAIEIDAGEKTCGDCSLQVDYWNRAYNRYDVLCTAFTRTLLPEDVRLPECLAAEEYMKTFDKES